MALNPMASVLMTDKGETHTRGKPCEDRGRDWSDVAMSRGTSGATRSWRRQKDPTLESSKGMEAPGNRYRFLYREVGCCCNNPLKMWAWLWNWVMLRGWRILRCMAAKA